MYHLSNEIRLPCNILCNLCRMKKSSGHMFVQIQNDDAAPLFHASFEGIRDPLFAMDFLAVTNFPVDKILRVLYPELKEVLTDNN